MGEQGWAKNETQVKPDADPRHVTDQGKISTTSLAIFSTKTPTVSPVHGGGVHPTTAPSVVGEYPEISVENRIRARKQLRPTAAARPKPGGRGKNASQRTRRLGLDTIAGEPATVSGRIPTGLHGQQDAGRLHRCGSVPFLDQGGPTTTRVASPHLPSGLRRLLA